MKDILVLAATGFEDTEMITTINVLEREGISFDIASIENLDEVKAQRFATIETIPLKKIDQRNYRGLFLPGGRGHKLLVDSQEVSKIVTSYVESNKIIAAICAAPTVLFNLGFLKDRKYTSFPGFAQSDNNTQNVVEVDKNIITGRDYLATSDFAFELVRTLKK